MGTLRRDYRQPRSTQARAYRASTPPPKLSSFTSLASILGALFTGRVFRRGGKTIRYAGYYRMGVKQRGRTWWAPAALWFRSRKAANHMARLRFGKRGQTSFVGAGQ